MAKKNVSVEDQNLENVQEALNTTTMWIEKNQKKLLIAVSAIVVLVVAVLGYNQYVVKPNQENINNETVNLPSREYCERSVHHVFPVLCQERDMLQQWLKHSSQKDIRSFQEAQTTIFS